MLLYLSHCLPQDSYNFLKEKIRSLLPEKFSLWFFIETSNAFEEKKYAGEPLVS